MQKYTDLKALSRVKDLPFVAKTLAQGFLQGVHQSRQRGVGIEFSQYRAYEPGDELGKVDWKLFARSDKYFVREAERESDIKVWFVLDCSRSMLQTSQSLKANEPKTNKASKHTGAGPLSKLEYSKYLIATMAYLAQKQGDSVGFLALSSEKVHFLPAFSGERHWKKLLLELAKLKPGGRFPDQEKIIAQVNTIQKHGVVILVSDFHQEDNEILELTCRLVNKRTHVSAFYLSNEEEISFPYQGAVRFEDLETKEEILVSASQVKAQYLHARREQVTSITNQFSKSKVQHVDVNIDLPLDDTLYHFLKTRARVVR